MTRKDYETIADAFKRCGEQTTIDKVWLELVALYVSENMLKDNPRFKVHTFLTACGLGANDNER